MEPKDLTNSEELKNNEKSDHENEDVKKSSDSLKENVKESTKKTDPEPERKEKPAEEKVIPKPKKSSKRKVGATKPKEDIPIEKSSPEEIKKVEKTPSKKEPEETSEDSVKKEKPKNKKEEKIKETKVPSAEKNKKTETKKPEEKSEEKSESKESATPEEKPVKKKKPEEEPVAKEEKLEKTVEETETRKESESPDKKNEEEVKVTSDVVSEETPEKKKDDSVSSKEKPVVEKKKKEEAVDYNKFTQVELINALRDILDNPDDYDLKAEIDTIKAAFYKQRNEIVESAKKAFVDEGGIEEEFEPEKDPYENDIKDLLKRYRQIRIEYNKKLDVEKEENLKKKYEVIEKIKGLINNEESINKTFNDFRDLQQEWREIGLVPQSKMKNLWDTYHFHVENFYDYIKINRELRDLDLKKNLEIKIGICESAEELLVEPSIIKAFNTLQKYHEQWREAGPVPRENKDDIWERFKAVTSKINKKHQEFFESRKTEQKKNLEAKTALCEKVEEILESEIANFKDWDVKSKELIELQKIWRTIGFAPRKDNNKIYERFRTSCDTFFNSKREFYAKNKEIQQNNLQLKIDLCVQAESLKDSTDWKKTTQDLINIQKQWKEIGPIPRKHSDAVWKRFRAACDYFFDKKSEHFSDVDSEQVDNLKLKEELIAEAEKLKSTGDVDKNLKTLKEFQRRWTEIGHVPFKKKDEVQNRFREAINKLFDELNIDEGKRNLLKFKSKMSSYSESNRGQNKMRMEREKYMNKLKQLENDLTLLDNNIGFFAKSKNAESLIKDVKKKIEDTKQKIVMLKEKIRVIDEMDNQ